MPENSLPPEVRAALEQLDDLIQAFEQHPDPAVQERVVSLLRCVDRIHRGGLRRVMELLRISGLEQPALNDPEVQLLFELYDLRDRGEIDRVDAVLEEIRTALEAHGGRLEVVAAHAGIITVRISGTYQSSPALLQQVIEQTLRDGLPDFVRLEMETIALPPATTFIPLSSLRLRQPERPG